MVRQAHHDKLCHSELVEGWKRLNFFLQKMLNKNETYAIIGASNNPQKYGYKILKDLHETGFKVIPVNPKGGEILGLKAYKNLSEIPKKIDMVIFVVPAQVTEKVLIEVDNLDIKKVRMQPGSESDQAISFCKEKGIECIAKACVMIERKNNKNTSF